MFPTLGFKEKGCRIAGTFAGPYLYHCSLPRNGVNAKAVIFQSQTPQHFWNYTPVTQVFCHNSPKVSGNIFPSTQILTHRTLAPYDQLHME